MNILPTNEATLPTFTSSTTKILPTKCLNITEPRIFCPPKITRYSYTVSGQNQFSSKPQTKLFFFLDCLLLSVIELCL